jgi:predicted esterase
MTGNTRFEDATRVSEFHVDARVRGRCLLEVPDAPERALLIGYHGYGERAEAQASRLRGIASAGRWIRLSVQALHPFYLGRTSTVGANWMTSADREMAIEDNLAYVAAAEDAVRREHAIDVVVHAGFSQGVAMAFRAALASRTAAGSVALGGDVPPELRSRPASDWLDLRVLLGRGARDEWYSQEKMDEDAAFLRTRPLRLATSVFDGGHEWLPVFSAAAGTLLGECLAAPRRSA